MSVLSNPQGTPERVWSLVAGLAALGGECDRQTFDALLNPGYIKDGELVRAKDTLAANALGAASSLGLVEAGREKAVLPACLKLADTSAFADYVHDRLSSLKSGETDSAILDAYSWLAAESDRQGGLGWIYDLGREQFADNANAALVGQDDDGRLMNTTKVVAWRRWLAFMGLGVPIPISNAFDFPTPTARLARELERADISAGTVIPADQFLTLLAGRMPYLDRGRLFTQACERIGHTPSSRRLSPLVSVALRDLHDDGILKLTLSGDASTHIQLSRDPAHSIDAFTAVSAFPLRVQ
jgi:hypothetical protein